MAGLRKVLQWVLGEEDTPQSMKRLPTHLPNLPCPERRAHQAHQWQTLPGPEGRYWCLGTMNHVPAPPTSESVPTRSDVDPDPDFTVNAHAELDFIDAENQREDALQSWFGGRSLNEREAAYIEELIGAGRKFGYTLTLADPRMVFHVSRRRMEANSPDNWLRAARSYVDSLDEAERYQSLLACCPEGNHSYLPGCMMVDVSE